MILTMWRKVKKMKNFEVEIKSVCEGERGFLVHKIYQLFMMNVMHEIKKMRLVKYRTHLLNLI